jgi:hypothetical protein
MRHVKLSSAIRCFGFCLGLLAVPSGPATADYSDRHWHPRHQLPPLVQLVRDATARFKDVQGAVAEGYQPGACVSSPNGGAMGVHYINGSLLGDGALDPTRPEALIYEPLPGGRLRLVGVEYITFYEAWHASNEAAPTLSGHQLNYTGSPNRYGIPAFYELHVWAWKRNPSGTFADWNPRVTCDAQPVQ